MASTTSPPDDPAWTGRIKQHHEFATKLAKRRAELDGPDMPRNAGNRRTSSKRLLLRAIEDAGGTW